ncbi:NTF2 domain-containing protein/RRM_6 domain-containing protein [Cephalotus follicularis]|uniref:NTF2 domain-containing protein/RRM_6 domain-containing protein n=1 Tax=Cephalotus follicularis TaxID=3775 RepID=A0A1Q3B0Y3_CEPFO|nr:NTF2 domain-containing protein/RRM_6 domain-containing protein [Cephalotus follicularis]
MADTAASSAHNPEEVGIAFVQQYYSILPTSPESVHKFYQEGSVLSRPGVDSVMTTASTLKGINDIILSLDYPNYHVEIFSADSQDSYMNGVFVLVTGCLTGKDDVSRKFTQSFFLAPQDRGYYVLNDIFRYVEEEELVDLAVNDNVDETAPTVMLTPDIDSTHDPNHPVVNHSTTVEKHIDYGNEVDQSLANRKVSVVSATNHTVVSSHNAAVEQNDVPLTAAPSQNDTHHDVAHPSTETTAKMQEDAPKKSYASIVNALKGNTAPFRSAPTKPMERPRAAPVPPEASAPSSISSLDRKIDRTVKGHSIFVANLPMNATVEQLAEIFKVHGTIKPDGVQVRSHKGMQGKLNCYGFVEFESADAVQRALEVSSILIGNRKAAIEEKKGNNNDTGRFQSVRGGYRDNFRSRENFNGGRNYRRNEFEKRADGQALRNGDGNQKAYQNGEGRDARQGQGQGRKKFVPEFS